MDVQVEGVEKILAPAPLLANLGKASANAYWIDITVRTALPPSSEVKEDAHRVGEQTQVTFNGQERTLRGIVASAG
jgi:hypothetical protein